MKKIKPPSEHLTYLDGWRGLAIALVLEAHFIGRLPLDTGRLGVDVFFCLSGFLMSGILFIRRQPLQKFYKHRISRIIPVFVTFVVVIYVFALGHGRSATWYEFLSTLLFLRTYIPETPGIWATSIPIGHLWSLNIEEHCYVLMSLLVLLRIFRGREGYVLFSTGVGCIVVGFLYVKLGTHAPPWGALGTEVAARHLLISAGYRLILEYKRFRVPKFAPLLSLAAAILCYSKVLPWWSYSLLSPFLLAFTVCHLSETYEGFKALLSIPPLRLLGIWSFSIYLWQQPFHSYQASIPGGAMPAMAGAIAVSLLSYYFLERPCRAWLNKNW